jgi:hypothetical protein
MKTNKCELHASNVSSAGVLETGSWYMHVLLWTVCEVDIEGWQFLKGDATSTWAFKLCRSYDGIQYCVFVFALFLMK